LLRHRRGAHRYAAAPQRRQGRFDAGLRLPRRQVQDLQVLLGRSLRLLPAQGVVGPAEAAGREQVVAVAVVGEGARLAHQPVDHVAVLDAMLAPTAQPRQPLHQPLAVPDLQVIGVQPRLDPLPDQAARHRVDVLAHVDGAAAIDAHPQPLAGLQPPRRQRPQHRQLLGLPLAPAGVTLREQLPEERLVGGLAGKVPAAAQHQGLVQGPLELAVALLDVAVLVGLAGVDGLAAHPVVAQQGLVTLLEDLPVAPGGHRRRQAVGAVDLRDAAQLPPGVLHARAEALEALGEADRTRLPVRVGQHVVVHQVREGRARDRHAQVGAVGEVTGAQAAGPMHLGEEHFLGRAVQGPPALDVALQRPQLALGKPAGVLALEPVEQGLGLQAGVQGQLLLDLGPDLGEGVRACPPRTLHGSHLAGQAAEPAVLAGGLVVHAGLGRCLALGESPQVEAAEAAHLRIGDHPKPPYGKGLRIAYGRGPAGNSNCR